MQALYRPSRKWKEKEKKKLKKQVNKGFPCVCEQIFKEN